MEISVQVRRHGRLPLPKGLRDRIGLTEGDWVCVTAIGDGQLRIEPVAPEAVERLAKPDSPSGSSPSR